MEPPGPAPPQPLMRRDVSKHSYVIGGLQFEVDTRYKIKSIVGKGAYGLVCAAEDMCAPAREEPSPKGPSGGPPPAEDSEILPVEPTMVAVKKVIDPFHDHTDCKRLLREIRLLRSLRHPNVLYLLDIMPPRSPAVADWKDVYLVTRLFDTNLHRVIYSGHPLSDAHIQYILWQAFRALRYLHQAGVVHRDMKPTNLLLNRDCELALADFGLARHMGHSSAAFAADSPSATADASAAAAAVSATPATAHAHACANETGLVGRSHPGTGGGTDAATSEGRTTAEPQASGRPATHPKGRSGQLTKYVVTRWYRAPELLVQNKDYDFKVDMWSTGCILAEVLGARAIFPGKDSLHQLRLVIDLLGLPSEDALEMIHNSQAVTYIRNLRPKEHEAVDPADAAKTRFARLFPDASPLLLDLLARLLQFDPRKRPTADEALQHPYLAAYRDAPEEGLPTPEIEMNFETESPSTDELRMLIWDEVLRYHPNLEDSGAPLLPSTSVASTDEQEAMKIC